MWRDVVRCGRDVDEMRRDVARYGKIWRDVARCGRDVDESTGVCYLSMEWRTVAIRKQRES